MYVETSALLKLFIDEEGRQEVLEAIDHEGTDIVTSRLTGIEMRAALAAARRGGRITKTALAAAKSWLDVLMDEVVQMDTSRELGDLAGDLAESERLRGSDALHLASALSVSTPELFMVTWDRDLARAARRSGLTTVGIV